MGPTIHRTGLHRKTTMSELAPNFNLFNKCRLIFTE